MLNNNRKKVAFMTLGCKVNQFETDAMHDLFKKSENPYEFVEFTEEADIYIVNTCTVTNVGDKKSRQIIRRGKKRNPNAILVVAGCYAQVSPEEIEKIEGVNIVIGTKFKSEIVDIVEGYDETKNKILVKVEDISNFAEFEEMTIKELEDRSRAFIKIQDGCNQFCSYCIIPFARGRVRSRDPEKILEEIYDLVERGYKEFVITGIHVTSYDWKEEYSLVDLLKDIEKIDGVKRIRLGSMEPVYLNEKNIIQMSKNKKICNHFHLSLQSGSSSVLKRMNRKYTAEEYFEVTKNLKKYFNNPALTTDIIVGFPGETEEEFEETIDFIKKIGFSEIHSFPYSIRNGTVAEKMDCQIDSQVKKDRMSSLSLVTESLFDAYRQNLIGYENSLLIEKVSPNEVKGYIDNYCEIVCEIDGKLSGEFDVSDGNILKILVKSYKNKKLYGEIKK